MLFMKETVTPLNLETLLVGHTSAITLAEVIYTYADGYVTLNTRQGFGQDMISGKFEMVTRLVNEEDGSVTMQIRVRECGYPTLTKESI